MERVSGSVALDAQILATWMDALKHRLWHCLCWFVLSADYSSNTAPLSSHGLLLSPFHLAHPFSPQSAMSILDEIPSPKSGDEMLESLPQGFPEDHPSQREGSPLHKAYTSRWQRPPRFWHTLSKVYLSRGSLREFELRISNAREPVFTPQSNIITAAHPPELHQVLGRRDTLIFVLPRSLSLRSSS